MSDVFAIFGTLLALGIIVPGTLTACWLLFPNFVGRAVSRLEVSPWHCLGLGAAAALLVGIPASLLIGLPGSLSKLLGGSLVTITLALAGIGAAGLVAAMSARLASQVGERLTPLAAFARSAIALELAAILPIIGWFIVLPGILLASLGATALALLKRTSLVPSPPASVSLGEHLQAQSESATR